jgi:hypothetical protein
MSILALLTGSSLWFIAAASITVGAAYEGR